MATAINQAGDELPLCIDLDGTLIKSDLTLESLLQAVRASPWIAALLPIWLLRGKRYFKQRLAAHANLDVACLPYDEQVVALARTARSGGRRVVLVTGSHRKYASEVEAHVGLFDELLATSDGVNLTGRNKADVLNDRFGRGNYEYAANGSVDIPVWEDAAAAITVDAPRRVVKRVAKMGKPHVDITRPAPTLRTWLRAARLHQWAKNLLLFVPIVTGHLVLDPRALAMGVLAFLCFGLCASATYMINDLFDLESDRRHATKRNRPFAAGTLDPRHGLVAAGLLLAGGIAGAFLLPFGFRTALGAYLVATLLYSFRLKRVASLDVILLAGLYTLRIIAGAFAVGITLSFWLLAFSMFIFLSLAMVKRVAELIDMRKLEQQQNQKLGLLHGREYETDDIFVLVALGASGGYLSVLVLAFYIQSPEVSLLYRTPEILWLIAPLMLIWVTRLWVVTARGYMHEDPIYFAVKDPETWITAAITGAILAAATLIEL